MSDNYEIFCEAWEVIDVADPKEQADQLSSLDYHIFSIHFSVTFNRYVLEDDGEEVLLDSCTLEHRGYVERDKLMDANNFKQEIKAMLSIVQIPAESSVINRILDCARTMACSKYYANRKVLRMNVRIYHDSIVDGDEDDGFDAMEGDFEIKRVPASKEMINNLATVEVNEESMGKQCVVCLEELSVGSKATRMPCLHIFHGDCIVKWLETQNSCPLCRSEICSQEMVQDQNV